MSEDVEETEEREHIPLDGDHCDFFNLNSNVCKLQLKERHNRKKCRPYVEVTLRLDHETFFDSKDVRGLKGGLFLIAEKGKVETDDNPLIEKG